MPRRFLPLVLVLVGLVLVVAYVLLQSDSGNEAASRPTPTPEPISPTRTPAPTGEAAQATDAAGLVAEPVSLPEIDGPICPDPNCPARFGVSGQPNIAVAAYEAGLPFGKYVSWWVEPDPPLPGQSTFWQMVKLNADGPAAGWDLIAGVVQAQPGAFWIVGNEPDVIWQDNLSAETYARHYHDVYTFIKSRDPSAQVAVAGVAQPTPLRLAYLDRVLDTYRAEYGQDMPVDFWTIHGFILREEAGSWGVDIPPGMSETSGRLYEIADHDNLDIFRQNLIDFRDWMAARGYQERPLALTEFGILHPNDYGFPPDKVIAYMAGALDFLINARGDNGFTADDGRLVQWWYWYSLYDGEQYPTGNLYDPETGRLTPLGQAYAAFIRGEQAAP